MSKKRETSKPSAASKPLKKLPRPEDGIGQRLALARQRADISSQAELSRRTVDIDPDKKGIARTAILDYERGSTKPGAREIRILCDTLRISPNYLLFGTEEPFKPTPQENPFFYGSEEQITVRLTGLLMALGKDERNAWLTVLTSALEAQLGTLRFNKIVSMMDTLSDAIASHGKAEIDAVATTISRTLKVGRSTKLKRTSS